MIAALILAQFLFPRDCPRQYRYAVDPLVGLANDPTRADNFIAEVFSDLHEAEARLDAMPEGQRENAAICQLFRRRSDGPEMAAEVRERFAVVYRATPLERDSQHIPIRWMVSAFQTADSAALYFDVTFQLDRKAVGIVTIDGGNPHFLVVSEEWTPCESRRR